MAKKLKVGRPTKIMMEAVNLELQGKHDEAVKHLKTVVHEQHTATNLERFA